MARTSDIDNYYAPYTPNTPAAIAAVAIFLILTAAHFWRLIKTKTWICLAFLIGSIFEVVGYASRGLGKKYADSLPLYIIQTLAILLAPILFAASVYMFLGRIIRATGCSSYSMIRTTWLTKIFVSGDILCFLIQGLGGSILASAKSKDKIDLGKYTILAGLLLQMVIFGLFMIVAAVFHVRMKKNKKGINTTTRFEWVKYMNMLYLVSVIITLRNLFRVIEYVMGKDAYLLTHEWPIYAFDAVPMAIVLAITIWWYVGDLSKIAMVTKDEVELLPKSREENQQQYHMYTGLNGRTVYAEEPQSQQTVGYEAYRNAARTGVAV